MYFFINLASSLFAVSSNGLDFSIKGKQATSTSAIIILLLNEDLSWSTVKVHYLISSRSDFNLGFFVVGIDFFMKTLTSFRSPAHPLVLLMIFMIGPTVNYRTVQSLSCQESKLSLRPTIWPLLA